MSHSDSKSPRFAGKVVVVTGASKGIGAEIARAFGREGASVVVNYASSKSGGDKVVNDIVASGGKAIAVGADLSKEADVRSLFAETKKAFGRLDVLVNNAGVFAFAPLEQVTGAEFHRQFNVNVLGLLLASQEAAKLFDEKGGSIINISSSITKLAPAGGGIYSATKASVDILTQVLAKELGPRKIRVNSVNPGLVETEGATAGGFSAAEGEFRKLYEATSPLRRIGQPNDIAPTVTFLASEQAGWITGEALHVSGGGMG